MKVKESFNYMIAILKQDIKGKRSNLIKSDLSKYFLDKNQVTEYTKCSWFKGSRQR